MEVIAARTLNTLYMYIDIVFLCLLAGVLLCTRRHTAVVVGALAGLLYFVVDYGIFYLALGTREVAGANPFWFLLWLSISYGFTNFVWIWLWLDNDGHRAEWSVFIVAGWLCTSLLSQNFGANFPEISISRGTGSYHGVMALLLFAGYAILCVRNVTGRDNAPILQILAIGVLAQGAWELILLITGVRPAGWMPLVVNSLLETNLGLPYLYWIHRAVTKKQAARQAAAGPRAAPRPA